MTYVYLKIQQGSKHQPGPVLGLQPWWALARPTLSAPSLSSTFHTGYLYQSRRQ